MSKLTCKELVSERLQSRVESIKEMLETFYEKANYDNKKDIDNALQTINEWGLSFDWVEETEDSDGFYRYQISWGGPSDEFQCVLEDDHIYIEYVYKDWWDYANKLLTHDDYNTVLEFLNIAVNLEDLKPIWGA